MEWSNKNYVFYSLRNRLLQKLIKHRWVFVSISTFGQEMMDSTIETYDFLENEIASMKIKYFIYKFDSR